MAQLDQIDPRLMQVGISIDGQLKQFSQPMWITSTGSKFTNANQSEAEVSIANLTKSDQDYLLNACSPFNKTNTPKLIVLSAGRQSTGLAQVFKGNIVSCEPSEPPDIILKFKCETGAFQKGNIVSSAQAASAPLSKIAGQVASDTGLTLDFQATDKNVSNYTFTGGALKQVSKLGNAGQYDAYVDDDTLVVKDDGVPLKGVMRILDANSGMVGIPKITEQGIKVTYLFDSQSRIGGALQITSTLYKALSGTYHIYKLNWHLTTREEQFYWIAECQRVGDNGQTIRPNPVPKHHRGKK